MICVSQRQAALLGKPVDALIHRHAKGLHSHRHQVVLADRENYIHQLLRVVPGVELGPGPITDVGVAMQFVHRTQQDAVETRPCPGRPSELW